MKVRRDSWRCPVQWVLHHESGMVSSSSTICGTSPVTRSTEVNLSSPCCASDPYVPRSRQLLVLVMVIPPLIGNPFSDYIHPYDDLPPAHFWDFRGMASHVSSASTSPSAIGVRNVGACHSLNIALHESVHVFSISEPHAHWVNSA